MQINTCTNPQVVSWQAGVVCHGLVGGVIHAEPGPGRGGEARAENGAAGAAGQGRLPLQVHLADEADRPGELVTLVAAQPRLAPRNPTSVTHSSVRNICSQTADIITRCNSTLKLD